MWRSPHVRSIGGWWNSCDCQKRRSHQRRRNLWQEEEARDDIVCHLKNCSRRRGVQPWDMMSGEGDRNHDVGNIMNTQWLDGLFESKNLHF
jgi:hypothetical protein